MDKKEKIIKGKCNHKDSTNIEYDWSRDGIDNNLIDKGGFVREYCFECDTILKSGQFKNYDAVSNMVSEILIESAEQIIGDKKGDKNE